MARPLPTDVGGRPISAPLPALDCTPLQLRMKWQQRPRPLVAYARGFTRGFKCVIF